MGLFDVHAHLTHPQLKSRVDELVMNAKASGLTSIISNGLHPEDNQAVLELSKKHSIVKAAFGFYPVDAVMQEMMDMGVDYPRDIDPVPAEEALAWVRAHVDQCIAVGEIGLDGYWVPEALWARQEEVFREFLKIALEANKPVILHTRKRERRTLEILKEMEVKRVDWHCFGGKVNLAREIAREGHFLSIPANAARHEAFKRIVETLPKEQVLLETDCPYLGPIPGQDNEPANVAHTFRLMSNIWNWSESDVQKQLEENYQRLFGEAP